MKSLRILVLGGTSEATALSQTLEEDNRFEPILSFAGRTQHPVLPIKETRIGGFGGVDGLTRYLNDNQIDLIVDATHPFAAQISRNVATASSVSGISVLALRRPEWQWKTGDLWQEVDSFSNAVTALGGEQRRIFLSIGRLELKYFEVAPQHHYLVRTIDPPDPMPDFHDWRLILSRGPFDVDSEQRLLTNHGIDCVVTKNSGAAATYAKIEAARQLQISVILIKQPTLPSVPQVNSVVDALYWIEAFLQDEA